MVDTKFITKKEAIYEKFDTHFRVVAFLAASTAAIGDLSGQAITVAQTAAVAEKKAQDAKFKAIQDEATKILAGKCKSKKKAK
jgi:hypothetical protein